MTERKARSPYKKYNKRPHRYSDIYRSWLEAVKKYGAASPEAREAAARHRAKFSGEIIPVQLAA